ncbi:MAG: DNA repair protein RecO [Anaerolineae bacterium]|nr:DNA repair protein RecO [Anaerolineae bacterium]
MTTMEERRQRLYRADAIVLKRRDHGEADRLLTVFSAQHGKLVLLAKGVRKTRSRKAGHVELFTYSTILIAKTRTWDLVTQAETVETYLGLRDDLSRTAQAYYVAELLDSFTQESDSNPPMFLLLRDTLNRLATVRDESLAIAVRFYELRLLGLAGYQPELFRCIECEDELQPVTNYYSTAGGGVLCPRHGEGQIGAEPLNLALFKTLRFMQTRDWDTVERLSLSPGLHTELERLLQATMVYHLERSLRSPVFIRILREQMLAHQKPVA